jgi:hypothetical protein
MFIKPDNWEELTPKERQQARLDFWVNGVGIDFASPEAEAAYKERATLLRNAFELDKTPARVPVYTLVGVYAQRRAGLNPKSIFYDHQMEAAQAHVKFFTDLQPDASVFALTFSGPALDCLDYQIMKWPGNGLPEEQSYQFVEREFMAEDEYELLLADPTDTMLRMLIPRMMPALKGLQKLPWFGSQYLPFEGLFMAFADPEVQEALEICKQVGELALAAGPVMGTLLFGPPALGFPQFYGQLSYAPFDALGDILRSTRGIMLDMFRRPDDVIAACDRYADLISKAPPMTFSTSPFVFIPLHKGDDTFMSREQFKTFYWPSLKKVMLRLVEDGLIPVPFAEGRYNQRVDIIADFPKESSMWLFDQTDMKKAKEVLGDVCTIIGNVPASLTATGTPEQMTAYCKTLIEDCAEGGNFILSNGCQVDEAKDENLLAMYDSVKQFGVY